jgi:hypothetical protein
MTSFLLSIASDAVKNDFSYWLFAASLPPLFYLLSKKKKPGWPRKLFIKWAIKRAKKLTNKKDRMSKGTALLLGILFILGIGVLSVWLLGWTWTIIIVLIGLLIIGTKRAERN